MQLQKECKQFVARRKIVTIKMHKFFDTPIEKWGLFLPIFESGWKGFVISPMDRIPKCQFHTQVLRNWQFLLPVFRNTYFWNPDARLWGRTSSPMEQPTWVETKCTPPTTHPPTVSTCLASHVSELLVSESSRPSGATLVNCLRAARVAVPHTQRAESENLHRPR